MKYLSIALMLIGGMSLVTTAQNDTTTRARVVPTATPPAIKNNPYPTTSAPDTAPVLRGGTRPMATPVPGDPTTKDDDDGIIRVETNLVTMPVSVLDRDGRFISGLQQRDFKIFENGVEQKVDYFQSVEQPFTVVLLIDVSPSTRFKIDEIHNSAIAFVHQLRAGDRVMVIAFDQDVIVLSEPTNNRAQLRDAIREAQFGEGTGLYDAVDHTIERELRRITGRKAVVLFTDGVDTTSRRASYDSTIRSTEEIDALFYTIRYDTSQDLYGGRGGGGSRRRGAGGVTIGDILAQIMRGGTVTMGGGYPGGGSQEEYAKGKLYLEALAQNSGGRAFEAPSIINVEAAFSGIAEELRRQYSLGYYPEVVGQLGERKQIRIRVMRPEVVVRAKNSYIVGQTNRGLSGK